MWISRFHDSHDFQTFDEGVGGCLYAVIGREHNGLHRREGVVYRPALGREESSTTTSVYLSPVHLHTYVHVVDLEVFDDPYRLVLITACVCGRACWGW